jgi:anti-anti-sigma regulatory factor
VFLDAIARPTVDISDMARIGRALRQTGQLDTVVVNLSGLETVNSSFLAGLLALRRIVNEIGGRLILCDLRPHVAEILGRLNLDVLFVIKRGERDALGA